MQKPQHDFEPIALLSMESVASRAFLESVHMKLYDVLERPQSAAQVAATFEMPVAAAQAFLDLLEARNLLVHSDGAYVNSPVASEYLVSHAPFYQGDCIELHEQMNACVVEQMTDLLHGAVASGGREGQKKLEPCRLTGIAQYSLRGGLQDAVGFISALPGFQEMRAMCDIGGSRGRYAMAILDRNAGMAATIADLPEVVAVASSMCSDSGYGDRLSFTACNLRSEMLPVQAFDLVLASHVLYPLVDRLDEIVAKAARALKPGGWFVAHHLDPGGEASRRFRTTVDLAMCLTQHARHVLQPADLKVAMQIAGLGDLRAGKSGFHEENLILAAQMPER